MLPRYNTERDDFDQGLNMLFSMHACILLFSLMFFPERSKEC